MLTYGGVPLLIPDADSELMRWMRQNQDIADGVFFGEWSLGEISPRRGLLNWYGYRKGIGQTVANYPPAPPPRLNSLYWPTGATRWARGYFLATERQKNKITALAHSAGGNTPLLLEWGDLDVRSALETRMYLLPPRPVSRPIAPYRHVDETLWLLPLVDERYWWQFKSTDDLEITSSTTWANLFSTLGTKLGVTVNLGSAVPAAYLSPDPYEFTRRYENPAQMLDAAALSVGKRIARRIDGAVWADTDNEAENILGQNVENAYKLMAGGFYAEEHGYRPAQLVCTFRKWRHYALLQKGQVYTETITPEITTATVSGTKKVVHSTMHADYSSDTSPPANTSDLNALAQAISDDYYGWLRSRYDITFAGSQPWTMNGFDDSVTWDFGRQIDGGPASGARLVQTRVTSMPVDFGFDLQLSQKNTLTLLEPMVLGKIDSSISKNARGTVSVWSGRSGSKTDSGINIQACASSAALSDTSKFVACTWVDDDWEVACWET